MKSIFGLVGILVVLVIMSLLVKTQLRSSTSDVSPAATVAGVNIKTTEGVTAAQASQQIQQQVKDRVKAAIETAPKPQDDK